MFYGTCKNVWKWKQLNTMEFYVITYQPTSTYVLQAATVFPLQNELAPQKLIVKSIYKASKQQTSGLLPGTITKKFHLFSFLYVLCRYVVYNAYFQSQSININSYTDAYVRNT